MKLLLALVVVSVLMIQGLGVLLQKATGPDKPLSSPLSLSGN